MIFPTAYRMHERFPSEPGELQRRYQTLIHVKISYKDRTPAFIDICYLKTLMAMIEECSIQDDFVGMEFTYGFEEELD